MLSLEEPTSGRWLSQVEGHLEELLIDHAHCEKKAAGVAMNLLFSYVDCVPLARAMTEIVEEELQHFRMVLDLLERRGVRFRKLAPSSYGARLQGLVRREEPARAVDRLLVAGLIEARSCERLWLLEQAGAGPAELATAPWLAFLLELERCEAGHAVGYRSLAAERFGPEAEARLDWWLDREAEVISALPWTSAVH